MAVSNRDLLNSDLTKEDEQTLQWVNAFLVSGINPTFDPNSLPLYNADSINWDFVNTTNSTMSEEPTKKKRKRQSQKNEDTVEKIALLETRVTQLEKVNTELQKGMTELAKNYQEQQLVLKKTIKSLTDMNMVFLQLFQPQIAMFNPLQTNTSTHQNFPETNSTAPEHSIPITPTPVYGYQNNHIFNGRQPSPVPSRITPTQPTQLISPSQKRT